ncbi:receptor-interacting serine/threonine-protein kinase 3 isoform X2 [Labrus bergylta]|uniref:receptor-interacting serine/threonine-protein kinase 3 isoform X2 n=1 Tax=Labrus bergylta TaxID=56723 RepID=UPI0009B3F17A|nr:receptor-interacting serine/threonine-protein kinase 3-like isoform X2 [Labrus bergylta]
MAKPSYLSMRTIEDSHLEGWEMIDSGGFGHVYKVKHRQWCSNVAIKLLRFDDSQTLLRELNMMYQGSSPYVIQVLGIFRGQLPSNPSSTQLGLVMELMERGSVAFLQKSLPGPPPWPLVFRMAHQVALGINFLHCLCPPVLHLDLKPSNVLLDPSLNAKLTDFGLSRFYHSSTQLSKKDTETEGGGTLPYMPPEAFDVNYKPKQASDIYSYGILLWSIVTGRKPYEHATSDLVRLLIPEGQRPSLDDIRSQVTGVAGLEVLMAVMEKCWRGNQDQRPSAHVCTTVTEELYKVHKHAMVDVVHQVLKELDQQEEGLVEQVQKVHISEVSVGARREEVNLYDSVPTGPAPVQPTRSSVHSSHNRVQNMFPELRRCSISSLLPCFPSPPSREYYINMSDVTGIQYGNGNTMHINLHERKRHPSAPPSVNFPSTQPGSRLDKKES